MVDLRFMTLRIDGKFEGSFVVSKSTRIWWILTWAFKSTEVIFHDTEKWCKIWRKTDLWFGKWHEEYGQLSLQHLKNLKIGTLMGSFYLK